jgi:hypothetical protein
MPTTKRRKPHTKSLPPIGHLTFKSVEDPSTWTNERHVEQLLGELPWMRAGVAVMNTNDHDLEANLRAGGAEAMEDMLTVAETLNRIRVRQEAGVEICRNGASRILIVLDRIHNGGAL